MEAYLEQIVDWILTLSPLSIYTIFFLVAYIENIIPPLPGDVLVAFGGYLAAEQIIGFVPVLIITTLASVIGFMNMYLFGKYFGDRIEVQRRRFWLMRFIDIKYFDRGKRWMHNWGQGVILANRFLAGTRSVIALTAGITKTKVYSTMLSSFISSLVWNFTLLMLGWIVYENWAVIGNYLNIYGRVILILIVVVVAARIFYKKTKSKKRDPKKNLSE
ncbi:DedA family protein [Rhodohalobacter mucosus]|nr:DedA family protein [Rhodohalobacter mucosus]